ncbi:hypothetical protein BDA96_04G346800 [Sorghum bicolor]|uniref:Eukaryotic translation initiation factor 3 subunit G n=1 Tax=Sorghum bicolor TaxID=4558 RepID=A0A921UL61_SORBI|nr:hypothetical protein BDA96_04G346800 [Sorghum bicolor]
MHKQQQQHTERWGDLLDDDGGDFDLGVLLPPPVVVGPDANGLKKVIEYHIDDEGNKVKVTTTTRVRKVRRSRRAIERRSWPKFGDAAKEAAGSRLTMVSTEEIFFDRTRAASGNTGDGAGPSTSADSLAKGNDKPGGGLLMVCRTCGKKGDHWTSKCPYKDLAPQQGESSGDRPPSADGSGGAAGGKGGSGAYVPVFKRLGGDRSGADVMRRRNDENSVRVSNLSEDARDPDLAELFGQFGQLSRVYVAIDRVTGESRGFGFVNFVHREDGERAINKLNGYGYDNLILHVEWAAPRPNYSF